MQQRISLCDFFQEWLVFRQKATCQLILPSPDFKRCLDSALICFDQTCIVLETSTEVHLQLVPVNYFVRVNFEAETSIKPLLRCQTCLHLL